MDQYGMDSTDDKSFDTDWEHAEDELIPIDNSHLSNEVREAEIRADEQLAADEASLEESIEQMQTLEDASVNEQVTPSDDVKGLSNDTPVDSNQSDQIHIGTELGLAAYNEGGRVEAPERRIYNNIIETENESSGNPERLG